LWISRSWNAAQKLLRCGSFDLYLVFGKKSLAHRKALAVYRGEEEPDRRVRARELLRLVK